MQFINLTLLTGESILVNRSKMHNISALGSGTIFKIENKVFKVQEAESLVSLDAPYVTGLLIDLPVLYKGAMQVNPINYTTVLMDDILYILNGTLSGSTVPVIYVYLVHKARYTALSTTIAVLPILNGNTSHGTSIPTTYSDAPTSEGIKDGEQPFFIFCADYNAFVLLGITWPCIVFYVTAKRIAWFDGSVMHNVSRPYKEYTVALTQEAVADPTLAILENEGIDMTLARTAEGVYTATTEDLLGYTYYFEKHKVISIAGDYMTVEAVNTPDTNDVFTIKTYTAAGAAADAKLVSTLFQLKYRLA